MATLTGSDELNDELGHDVDACPDGQLCDDSLDNAEDDQPDDPADAPDDSPDDSPDGDYRRKPRRRGLELRSAIYQATLAELTENGYAELTMDRVAARAKASKGSLYRRWASRAELVVDALKSTQVRYSAPPDTGDLRGELVELMHRVAGSHSGMRGEAIRGLIAEVSRHPDLVRTLRAEIVDTAVAPMLEVLRRGVVRHEVRPGALTPLVARVGPSLLRHRMLTFGDTELEEGFIEDLVDQVLLPLVRTHPAPSAAT
jgi:AcrR family transcriptional regulator